MSPTHAEPRIFQPGDIFRDHYVVKDFLGEGASGQVYKIEHRFTGAHAALKVVHLKDRNSAVAARRALVDARAGYAIQHRNVARVLDLAVEDDGMVWHIRELLDGRSVADVIARYGKLTPFRAIDVALEICSALQAAHELQIIHRDVHPGNVFITAGGIVKVLDFSLAKAIPFSLETTEGRDVVGMVAFMGPEQIKHLPATPQFDVYALGMLFWCMIVGRHPFESTIGNVFLTVGRQLEEEPGSLAAAAALPAYVDDVFRAATAKDPAKRYANMWQMARALGDLRAALAADRATGRVVLEPPPQWESECPIRRDPEGHNEYTPPVSLPGQAPEPHLPSKRIVVAQPAPARGVPLTEPMTAFAGPPAVLPQAASLAASGVDVAAPTIRGRRLPAAAPAPRRWWPLFVAPPALIAAGVGVWLVVPTSDGTPAPTAPPSPTVIPRPSASAPRAPAAPASAPSSAASAPRRPAGARPGR